MICKNLSAEYERQGLFPLHNVILAVLKCTTSIYHLQLKLIMVQNIKKNIQLD